MEKICALFPAKTVALGPVSARQQVRKRLLEGVLRRARLVAQFIDGLVDAVDLAHPI